MPSFLYIDTLRIVSQGTICNSRSLKDEDVDFFLLGSFDAMKIITHKYTNPTEKIDSLSDLVEQNRFRHKAAHSLFDRQPLYLYSEEAVSTVFSKEGRYADLPLVMALVQIQDEAMDLVDPKALIDAFKDHIKTLLHSFDSDNENIEFEVFYDLGEADVVIVFRAPTIRNIGRVLFNLRWWEEMSEDRRYGIRVLSICSHCAFPKQENTDIYYKKLNTWMTQEWGNSTQFVTFIDTSYGMDAKDKVSQKHFAFDQYMIGAFDFSEINSRDTSAFARRCEYIVSQLQYGNDHCFPFRTALSIPIVQLTEEDILAYPNDRIIDTIRPSYALLDQYVLPAMHFEKLATYIMELSTKYNIWGNNESALQLKRDVESLNVTLIGLLKHLIRLKEGRFEGDLYAFVAPVFEQMPKIAASYLNLIRHLADIYQTVMNDQTKAQKNLDRIKNDQEKVQSLKDRIKKDQEEMEDISGRIYDLYNEYVTDASRLITGLQHLLSVLSISPHNYLETYGSNMRSISATCKLLAAYQGVTYGVAEAFDMKLKDWQHSEEDVKTNEVLLVLPYRRIKQSTRTLFEHSSPEQRIATIRLDYSSMLDIDQTLIVLLHEVGHHIMTSCFRMERWEPLYNAVFAYLLQEGLGDIYRNPVEAICEPINTHGKVHTIEWVWDKDSDDEKDRVSKLIQDKIKEVACLIVENLTTRFIMQENNFIANVIYKEERFALENRFSMMQGKALKNFIEEKLKAAYQEGQQTEFKPDDIWFVISIEKLYIDAVYDMFFQFASEQHKRKVRTESNDLWRIDELCSYYREIERYRRNRERYQQEWEHYRKAEKKCKEHPDWPQPQKPKECMPGMLKSSIKDMLECIEKKHKLCLDEIPYMFSDIYSDAFAVYMLRLDGQTTEKDALADQYLKTIKDTAAFEANSYFDKYHVLLRIYIVLTKFYGLEEEPALEIMSRKLSAGTGVSSENIAENIRFIRNSLYYGYVSKFADICKESLLEKRRTTRMDEITKELNEFYNGARMKNTKAVAKGIHCFWKRSTTRGL